MITWLPYGASLSAIAAGNYDSYLKTWADAARATGKTIYVRFAHEMNGKWEPWGYGVNGNTAAEYVAAWQHVVNVFRGENALNVKWVWCIATSGDQASIPALYPGDAYVDWVAMDGYNRDRNGNWRMASQIFTTDYDLLSSMTTKPLMVAETASVEDSTDVTRKASWIENTFLTQFPAMPRIRAALYFDAPGTSYRVTDPWSSTSNSLGAMRLVFASPLYDTGVNHPPSWIAVTGTNHAVFIRSSNTWISIGGVATSAPAVVTGSNGPYFLVDGSDHNVWIRTLTQNWNRFTPSGYCLDRPGALLANGTLYVACEGGNHAVYVATATVPATGLPQATGWSSLGGMVATGPAVGLVAGTVTYFVCGTNSRLYSRTASTGWSLLPWQSHASPGIATDASTGQAVLAFQGTNHAMYISTHGTSGSWSAASDLGGYILGGPGVAALPTGTAYYVEGGNTAVFTRTSATTWLSLGGKVLYGASATAS